MNNRSTRHTGSPASGVASGDIKEMRAATIPSYLRNCFTPQGRVRLTPAEVQILTFLERHEGLACSKSQIAEAIGRNEKTVSRLISRLRQYQILKSQPSFAESGSQLANVYFIANGGITKSEEGLSDDCDGDVEKSNDDNSLEEMTTRSRALGAGSQPGN